MGMEEPRAHPKHVATVKKLIELRSLRGTNIRLALDVIEFLQLEDGRLDVIFLTLHCEEIPSRVHERDCMKEVYLLLEKNEYEYTEVMENLYEKELAINAHTKMLEVIKKDMAKGFGVIADMLKNMQTSNVNTDPSEALTADIISGSTYTSIGSVPELVQSTALSGSTVQLPFLPPTAMEQLSQSLTQGALETVSPTAAALETAAAVDTAAAVEAAAAVENPTASTVEVVAMVTSDAAPTQLLTHSENDFNNVSILEEGELDGL